MNIFNKRFPTPQEFKEIWQPKAWARNKVRGQEELVSLLSFIGSKLRNGEATIASDAISGRISREDLDRALAVRGWKLNKQSTCGFYELLPLDSETPEDPPF